MQICSLYVCLYIASYTLFTLQLNKPSSSLIAQTARDWPHNAFYMSLGI